MSWLVAHEGVHLIVGLGAALIVLAVTRSRTAAVVAVLWSLLIDIDHIVDYLVARGLTLDVAAIVSGSYFAENQRLFVPLHSWELGAALIGVGWIRRGSRWGAYAIALGLGTVGHLIIDQVVYAVPPGTYFLVLRVLHGFAVPESWSW